MSQSIYISDDDGEPMKQILEALGDEPTITITMRGGAATGKTTIAHMMKNSIKKNLFDTGKFREPCRILINTTTKESP